MQRKQLSGECSQKPRREREKRSLEIVWNIKVKVKRRKTAFKGTVMV